MRLSFESPPCRRPELDDACRLIYLILTFFVCGCPNQAKKSMLIDPARPLPQIDRVKAEVLARYLASSSRWSVHTINQTLVGFKQYEHRSEAANGYFSEYDEDNRFAQYRVAVSFGSRLKHDVAEAVVTNVSSPVTIELQDVIGGVTWKSCLVIENDVVVISIYEESADRDRHFTRDAFHEVCAELNEVFRHMSTVQESGLLPATSHFAEPLPTNRYFTIEEASQPGIYEVKAALNPGKRGNAFLRIYEGSVQVAPQVIEMQSSRFVGWDTKGEHLFPYSSRVILYGGTTGGPALESAMKFELWHRSDALEEIKVAEATRLARKWIR